jgi:mannose-6-phosphate isomerase
MAHVRLQMHRVEKVWGRTVLGHGFAPAAEGAEPIGEIWFQQADVPALEPELLVKYLFTSERLSIQVHPDDEAARRKGEPRGKDEAWIVLAAEPDAAIAIGTHASMTADELRRSALDGDMDDKVRWWPAKPGDVFFAPSGTVHAIGPGLTVIEVQQNSDTTYRLYDYGRPRELHLDDGIAASRPEPYGWSPENRTLPGGRTVLVDSRAFVLERWDAATPGQLRASQDRPVWLVPVSGTGRIDGAAFEAGGVWLVAGEAEIDPGAGMDLLVAYPRAGVVPELWSSAAA